MDIGVPSRFACLRIEDDDHRSQNVKSKDPKKKNDPKLPSKKSNTSNTKSDKNAKNKKISNNKQPLQSAATKSKKNGNSFQWDEWKLRDDEIVNGNYEQDLQDAILLSKLDYEHNKELYKNVKEINGNTNQQPPSKKKKNKAMSINEFLNSNNEKKLLVSDNLDIHSKPENESKDPHFFDDVKNAAKEEFNKELIIEKRKKREVNIDKIITLAQCQEKLEEEKAKNFALQLELDKAKEEVVAVKERNRALCSILGQGEMKDKADVLLELEKLYTEKNDLTEEVTRLHVQLEQERSKVAALSSDSHKHKDKKRKQKGA